MTVDIEHKRELKREQMRRYRQRKNVLQGTTEGTTRHTTVSTTKPSTSTTKSTTNRYYRPTTKVLQNKLESTTVEPYSSRANTEGNLRRVTPKPIEPVFKPAKNANPVLAKPVAPVEEPNFWDFAFRTDKQRAYENVKRDRYKQRKKDATTWSDWVIALVGFGGD